MKKIILLFGAILLCFVETSAQIAGTHLPNHDDGIQVYDNVNGIDGPCNHARNTYKKCEERTFQYEQDIENYKNGKFCSECKRSKRQIESSKKESFEEHLSRVHGEPFPATREMYEQLYKEYITEWNNLKKQYDSYVDQCRTGNIKLKQEEQDQTRKFNSEMKIFSANEAKINNYISSIKDLPTKQKIAAKLQTYEQVFKTLNTECQQNITAHNLKLVNQNIVDLQKLNDDVLNLLGDYKEGNIAQNNNPTRNNETVTKNVNQEALERQKAREQENRQKAVDEANRQKQQQAQQYQNQANSYLNAAQNNQGTAITQSMNYGLAKINATAAGNTKQANQITQMQQQAQQDNFNNAANSLTNLLNLQIQQQAQRRARDEAARKQEKEEREERERQQEKAREQEQQDRRERDREVQERAKNATTASLEIQPQTAINSNLSFTIYDCELKAEQFAKQENYKEAFKWYKMGTEIVYSDPEKTPKLYLGMVQNNVAAYYSQGIGVEKDLSKAFKYLTLAAENSYKPAMLPLARYYQNGWGTQKDIAKAIEWYKKIVELRFDEKITEEAKNELKKLNQ